MDRRKLLAVLAVLVLVGCGRRTSPNRDPARALFSPQEHTARNQMSNIAKAIDLYKLDNGGKIPRTLDALTQKRKQFDWAFMDNIPDDPWGNPYEYRPEGTDSYRIISYGPDGNPGSDDDLHGPAPR